MERRLAARLPLVLFTLRLEPGSHGEKPGEIKELLHSTDWVNHLLFSPTDPELLMYCHEGPWQKVDRIWMIHTDGTHNTLIHKRTMVNEIAGHEFWGLDGETIWYDWQYPKGEDFFLAGYNLKTGKHTAYHMQRDEWSIHFNVSADGSLFCGDGGDPGQVAKAPDGDWIYLFRPTMVRGGSFRDKKDLIDVGYFKAERLADMTKHDYSKDRGVEPNLTFTPDMKWIIFSGNFHSPRINGRAVTHTYAVEIARADQKS